MEPDANSRTRRRRTVRCALLPVACLLAGCGGGAETVDTPREFSTVRVEEVRPAGDGIDVEFWVVDLSADALARALASVRKDEWTDSQGELWRSNGLRIFKTRSVEAARIGSSLPLEGQARRESLPLLPRWSSLAGGRVWNSGVEFWFDQQDWSVDPGEVPPVVTNGRMSLPPGAMRLLARTWPVAAPTDDSQVLPEAGVVPGALVVQIVPQHVESRGAAREFSLSGPSLVSAMQQGQVFDRLTVELVCRPGEAIIIVPAHPREKWKSGEPSAAGALPPPESRTPGRPGDALPGPSGGEGPSILPVPAGQGSGGSHHSSATIDDEPAARPDSFGPEVPDLLSLGEAMLTDATVGGRVQRRVILVITPRISGRFDPMPTATVRPAE